MCTVDGIEVPFTGVVSINGYSIGERLLEDVPFRFIVTDGAIDLDSVRVDPIYDDYFEKFNAEYWYKLAKECAAGEDAFNCEESKLKIDHEMVDNQEVPGEVWQIFSK